MRSSYSGMQGGIEARMLITEESEMFAGQDARFTDKVFERCIVATDKVGSFTLEDIEKEFVSPDQSDEANYWTKKHVASALSICQSIKLISSELVVRPTSSNRLPMEVPVGKVT